MVPELKNLTPALEVNSGIQITGGPDRLYALRRAQWEDEAALVLVSAAVPEALSVYHDPAASVVHGAQFEGTLLYTVGASGLAIHDVGGIVRIPTEARVRVEQTAAMDLGDFSVEPDDVISTHAPTAPAIKQAKAATTRVMRKRRAVGNTNRGAGAVALALVATG